MDKNEEEYLAEWNRLHVSGGANSFKDGPVSGVAGGANVSYDLTPELTVGMDVNGHYVRAPDGTHKDLSVTGLTATYKKRKNRLSGRVGKDGSVGITYERELD